MINQIQEGLNRHLIEFTNNCDYEWLGIFLFGSQNYGLGDESSDIDTYIIYFPPSRDTPMLTKYFDNGEQSNAISIYDFYYNLKQMNFITLEMLFTPYFILNPKYEEWWHILLSYRDKIAYMDKNKWLIEFERLVLMTEDRFIHETTMDIENLKKDGYAFKPLYHLLRLRDMVDKYNLDEPYQEILLPRCLDYIKQLKNNHSLLSPEDAYKLVRHLVYESREHCFIEQKYSTDLITQHKVYKHFKQLI